MDCISCKSKHCKANAKDCNNRKVEAISILREEDNNITYNYSDQLVANGRAGSLSRLEEIAEYALLNNYKTIALAYCFALEKEALQVKKFLTGKGFKCTSVRCTINGIKENEVVPQLKDSVNCNPIGQALAVNEDPSDLVIEIGLCLGHDILFHKYLKKPFTTLIVKDRVYNHNPIAALRENDTAKNKDVFSAAETFFSEIGPQFGMKNREWLKEQIAENNDLVIIDFRGEEAFSKKKIKDSHNIQLKNLPHKFKELIPSKKSTIVCICNGAIQSAYAVMFLRMQGYNNTYNLSGGFAGWEKSEMI